VVRRASRVQWGWKQMGLGFKLMQLVASFVSKGGRGRSGPRYGAVSWICSWLVMPLVRPARAPRSLRRALPDFSTPAAL
jgi:hypothetical protein